MPTPENMRKPVRMAPAGPWSGNGPACTCTTRQRIDVPESRRPARAQRSSRQKARGKLLPYLDDFAQIAGVNLRIARFNPNSQLESAKLVGKALKRHSAVLLEANGALCIGSNLEEARAVEIVAEKNCGVSIAADLFQKVKPIGLLDSVIMRLVYVQKYAKKK